MGSSMESADHSHAAIWVAALHFAIGLGVAVFGTAVLVTYHNGLPLLQFPGGDRLQYDTAWVIVLDGVSLLLYALTLRVVAKLCAAVTVLISGLRLVAYVLPTTLDTHPILANPWLRSAHGEYVAMGVLTALVTLLLGTALAFLLPAAQRTAARTVTLAILASTVMALSLLLAFGAWSGSSLAVQALQLNGDERINSLVFLLLGATLLIYTLTGTKHERLALGRFAPVIVGLSVFVCVLVVWRAALAQEFRYVRHGTELVATAASSALERDMRSRIQILERLAYRMSSRPYDADVFRQEAEAILQDVSEFRAVGWSGPDNLVRWVTPYDAPLIGYNQLTDPTRRSAIERASTTRQTTLTPFTKLMIGGRGVIVYAPAFQGSELRGLVSSSFSGNWLKTLVGDRYPDQQFELLENAQIQQTASGEGPKAGPEWAVDSPMAIYNQHWVLRVTPSQAFVIQSRSALPEAGLGLGTVLSLLLAIATYFYQAARRRARHVATVNQQLIEDGTRREQAELRLRESEQRNRLIVNSVKDCAIYMLEPDGTIASWNTGAQSLNGYWPDEVMGRHFSLLYPADRIVPSEDELVVAAHRGWFEEECWHQRKDGTRYCGDDMISAIRDEQSELKGFAVVTRDATFRIEMREHVERARDYYLSLFSSFPNLVWRSDPYGSCDYLNQAWLEYTGTTLEHQKGAGWLDAVHPDDRQAWQEHIDVIFLTQQPFELEFRLRRADGDYGSMICSARPYYDLQAQFAGYLCSCYDNTARRAAESALKESEERYERITTNVPGMVFKLSRQDEGFYRFLYASFGTYAITGLDPATVTANFGAFIELVHADDRASLLASLEDSARRQTTWLWSGRLNSARDGLEKWISVRAKPRLAETQMVIWDGVIFDDSQSRRAQLEIERSREESRSLSRHLQTVREEEKARIAREVHDELGSTLTGLRIDLDWLVERQEDATEGARRKYEGMVSLVASAVAATRRIVTDLRPSILDDLGLASALRWQLSEYQKHSEVHFELDVPEEDLDIDRERALVLFRIFQETTTNVSRHAKATELHIQLSQSQNSIVMQIRDNGIGIGEQDMRKPASHGLRGMRERAEQFGGSLAISGQAGIGTTIVVTLPQGATA
jgi:PAS domain S-box-containing protein